MKNYKYLLLVSTCLLFNNNALASGLDLTFNSSSLPFGISTTLHTHTPNVELKPISNFNSVKLAAVCHITNIYCTNIICNTDSELGCRSDVDMNIDNAAQCRDEGFGTSCPSGYVPDTSQKCPYNSSFYKCRVCSHSCSSGSLAYCNSNQIETGSSRNDCNETCYTCRAKTCDDGGYSSSISSCQKATAVSFAGKTCYTAVSGKNCTDGGYSASIPSNQTCSSTSYCGNTCYHSCSQPACSVGGFRDAIPTNQTCTSTTYYGQTCYKDCYTPNCGAGGYNASIPSNNLCSSVNYYGQTCYNNCYQPQCSAGGFEASIPSGKNCTAVSYYGRSCYKDCVNSCVPNSCSGYDLSSCPANGSCSSCTIGCGDNSTKYKLNGCSSGYTLSGGICVANDCPDGYESDCSRCQNGYGSTKIGPTGKYCYRCCSFAVNNRPDGGKVCLDCMTIR